MVPKQNTYIEAVLKQAGFDSFIAQKINAYNKYYEQKLKSVLSFYDYLKMYNVSLEIRQGDEYVKLNPIERYYVLYKYSAFLEGFSIKIKVILDTIVKRFNASVKLHLDNKKELKLGFLEIIHARTYCQQGN